MTIIVLALAYQLWIWCRVRFFRSDEDYMAETFVELELAENLRLTSKEPLLSKSYLG